MRIVCAPTDAPAQIKNAAANVATRRNLKVTPVNNKTKSASMALVITPIESRLEPKSKPRALAQLLALAHVQADESAFGVAAVDATIRENGDGPAFAAEDLRAGDGLEAGRTRGRDGQL